MRAADVLLYSGARFRSYELFHISRARDCADPDNLTAIAHRQASSPPFVLVRVPQLSGKPPRKPLAIFLQLSPNRLRDRPPGSSISGRDLAALWTDFVPKVAAKSSSSRGERTSRVHRRKPAQSESFDNGGGRDAAGSRQESRTRKPFCI